MLGTRREGSESEEDDEKEEQAEQVNTAEKDWGGDITGKLCLATHPGPYLACDLLSTGMGTETCPKLSKSMFLTDVLSMACAGVCKVWDFHSIPAEPQL